MFALVLSLSLASPMMPSVVAVPFGADIAGKALSDAVDAALPKAASERGLTALRADKVKPVAEAFKACRDDGCRVAAARRLGARWCVLGAVDKGALVLRIIDVEVGDAAGSQRVDGKPPAVLGLTPSAVDALLEQVAPRALRVRAEALARAQRARASGALDDADAAYGDALAAPPRGPDVDAPDLWLARAKMFTIAGVRDREISTWDALAAAIGPGTPAYADLDDAAKKRVGAALKEHLTARTAFQLDVADHDKGPDHASLVALAAKTQLRIAALFPEDAPAALFMAAELYREAGMGAEARPLYERVANDAAADADLRVKALARAREK